MKHMWRRNADGNIKIIVRSVSCIGPTCVRCGGIFCSACFFATYTLDLYGVDWCLLEPRHIQINYRKGTPWI